MIWYKLLMLFSSSDIKETNQILEGKNMKPPTIALRFLTPRKLKNAILFNEDGKGTLFFIS